MRRVSNDTQEIQKNQSLNRSAENATVLLEATEVTVCRKRVLIVDDHSTIRQMIKIILKGYPDVDVVGEASNGQEAVVAAGMLQPTIIVMDVNMPLMNGIEATRMVKSRHPAITIIGLSVNPNDEYRRAMKDAGAATLLRKETAVEELYEAIQKGVGQIFDPCSSARA